MILNNSSDPVFIKKIDLSIWLVRDEIENAIEKAYIRDKDSVKSKVLALKKEYENESQISDPGPDETNNVLDLPVAEKQGSDEQEAKEDSEEITPDPANEEQNPEDDIESSEGETQAQDGENTEATQEQTENAEENNISDFIPKNDETDSQGIQVLQRRPVLSESRRINGTCILSEVHMEGIYMFCNRNMLAGQSIMIDFLVPKRFVLSAEIVFCRPYNMRSRIISENNLPFRVAARFTFKHEGERTLLRQFLETVEPDVAPTPQKVKKVAKKQEEESDLDDLDDLDL